MSLSTTPAQARTDAAPAGPRTAPVRPAVSTRSVRRAGAAVAAGSAAWAGGILAFGLDPVDGWQGTVYNLSSLAFQLGLVALVTVQLRTGATGTGKLARSSLHAEHVLLGLAMVSTLLYAVLPEYREEAWFLALDAFWPLSMVGMFAIGIRIAIAGRWTGAARWWPLGAESWAPVNIPIAQALPTLSPYVAAGHLLLGYAALGVLLALRPELTGARD
ncbi:hypothetical protein [Geodermatophilus sabuli]|uniref:Uncharacterized protein n=1 Tax=Geodermatophilus sabuli TaxID=1564158 RepID=A0A285EDF8_9ACTN|nr:hypothetical protein [Geodermatophilus sabuli]MBB3085459.1 hypothetical protein [Geodermatophilus sabuli]SNX96116.1 hypothetical protein SAMN06893097_103285 [Geodermatophilus sabuli]